jgi:hypothetical protein
MREAAETRSYAAALSVLIVAALSRLGFPRAEAATGQLRALSGRPSRLPRWPRLIRTAAAVKKELGGRRNGPEGRNIRIDEKAQPPALGEERRHVVFRFARDSPLEGAGFEPSVPRQRTLFETAPFELAFPMERHCGFESLFLHRRVWLREF